jgi:hypothetical protein
MNDALKQAVVQILDAIEYKEDKKAFVDDFIRITNSQALVDLVQSLPTEKQAEADKEIAEADSQESFQKAVQKYFTDAQVEKAIDIASQRAVTEWLKAIDPTLTDQQREKLLALSEDLQKAL